MKRPHGDDEPEAGPSRSTGNQQMDFVDEEEVMKTVQAAVLVSSQHMKREAEDDNKDISFQPEVISKVSTLVYDFVNIWTNDLIAFSEHAGRETVTLDDVLLLTRRNPQLAELIKAHPLFITEPVEAPKKKRGPRKSIKNTKEPSPESVPLATSTPFKSTSKNFPALTGITPILKVNNSVHGDADLPIILEESSPPVTPTKDRTLTNDPVDLPMELLSSSPRAIEPEPVPRNETIHLPSSSPRSVRTCREEPVQVNPASSVSYDSFDDDIVVTKEKDSFDDDVVVDKQHDSFDDDIVVTVPSPAKEPQPLADETVLSKKKSPQTEEQDLFLNSGLDDSGDIFQVSPEKENVQKQTKNSNKKEEEEDEATLTLEDTLAVVSKTNSIHSVTVTANPTEQLWNNQFSEFNFDSPGPIAGEIRPQQSQKSVKKSVKKIKPFSFDDSFDDDFADISTEAPRPSVTPKRRTKQTRLNRQNKAAELSKTSQKDKSGYDSFDDDIIVDLD